MGWLSDLGKGLTSGIGGIASSLIGGGVSYASAKDQMKFQREMSGTAHQREVKDLKAAGLNPILSARYGGASTPGGAGYELPNVAGSVSSAASARNLTKQSDVLDKDVAKANIELNILREFPEVAIAQMLKDTSPANLAAAAAIHRGKRIIGEGSNSAQSFGTKYNKFDPDKHDPKGSRFVGTKPLKSKITRKREPYYVGSGEITPQEMLEINKQIREKIRRRHE